MSSLKDTVADKDLSARLIASIFALAYMDTKSITLML